MPRRQGGDARAHEAGADDAQRAGAPRRGGGARGDRAMRPAGAPQPHQVARHRRDRELSEALGLDPQRPLAAAREARRDGVEDGMRRRIVAAALAPHAPPRRRQDEPPRDRVRGEPIGDPAARGLGARPRQPGAGRALEERRRNELVDQTPLAGLARAETPAGEQQIEAAPQTDLLRHGPGAAQRRQETELHLRQSEHGRRLVARHAKGRRQGQLQAAAERRAADRGGRRVRQPAPALEELLAALHPLAGRLRLLEALDLVEIGADQEGPRPSRDEHQSARAGEVLQRRQELLEILESGGAERVDGPAGRGDRHHGHAVVTHSRVKVESRSSRATPARRPWRSHGRRRRRP